MQKEEATVLSGCQDRPKVGRWWRTTAIVAMAGGLALSGCTTNTDTSGPATSTTAAAAKKVDEIAATIHPHPTISETIMEAAESVFGQAIHSAK